MSPFNLNMEEMLTFFAVLVRYSILFSVLPFVGDKMVPSTVKVLLALAVSLVLYPALISSGKINSREALVWGSNASSIIGTIALEVLVGLTLGYTAKLIFDAISFGGNLVGTFMGFASASQYDPHQESQTQVISQLQSAIAMLLFLSLDGHHLMLKTSLESYKIVGLGRFVGGSLLGERLIALSGETIRLGISLAAPVAVAIFSVNIVFGVLSKTLPQLNIFMLSAAVTALVGFSVLLISIPEFQGELAVIFSKMSDWQEGILATLVARR